MAGYSLCSPSRVLFKHVWSPAIHRVSIGGMGTLKRREFVCRLSLATVALAGCASAVGQDRPARRIRFGLIADIHQDVMPDGLVRVDAFVRAMQEAKADFILQLGDFCVPAPRNQPFLDAWNRFGGPRFHVLGNHDMDGGYTREQSAAFFGMPHKHCAFPAGPVRGIVLDGNEPGGKAGGYKRFLGAEQLAWLRQQLTQGDRPALVFIHQAIDADHDGCLENSAAVRGVLEEAERAIPGSVVAVFSGHLHLDDTRVINGIRYVQINSASYWWLNNPAARRETYPPEVHKAHPYLTHVAAYRDPLWALVTLDFESAELVIQGRHTQWVGPDPWARGEQVPWTRDQLHPGISDRRLSCMSGLLSGSSG